MNGASDITLPVSQAEFPQPFPGGLEFNAPARGMWNIVHTGMLMPEAHQIFICARGCLRGVILTAAEMNAMDRMSWVGIEENDFFDNSMEDNVIEGVTEILGKLPRRPPAVLVFVSCIQLFAGMDFPRCIKELSARFPDIDFVDCYMNPTMRKSGLTPDQLMRKQLFAPLKKEACLEHSAVNLLGSDFAADRNCEIFHWFDKNGVICREITRCKSYDAFLEMGKSFLNMTWIPQAAAAGAELENRLGQKNLHLPLCYGEEEIDRNYALLAQELKIALPDFSEQKHHAAEKLQETLQLIGQREIVIDYTATPRVLSLARRLLEAGFNVTTIYADTFIPGDKGDFDFLKVHFPQLKIVPTLHVKMRFCNVSSPRNGVLAIGQKAAFFTGTSNFVDLVWGRGFYGHSGVAAITELMAEAVRVPKETKSVISHKGWGCESCL